MGACLHRAELLPVAGEHQARVAVLVARVSVRAGVEQERGDRRVAAAAGLDDGRVAELVRRLQLLLRSSLRQSASDGEVARARRSAGRRWRAEP